MTLIELLTIHADNIIKDTLDGVERSQLPLYRYSGSEQTRQRVKALFVLTARAIKERNRGPMLAHAETIGRERFAAGADLAEIQIAFNVLEEVLWHRILTSIPPVSYGEALGLVVQYCKPDPFPTDRFSYRNHRLSPHTDRNASS